MDEKEQIQAIKQVKGYVTNVDLPDLSEEYSEEAVNVRFERPSVIGERDYGTKHLFTSYPVGQTIVDCHWLYIATEQKEYCILVTLDVNQNTRIWVRPLDESTGWDELTKVFKCTVVTTPGATDLFVVVGSITDINNDSVVLNANDVQYYIAYNVTRGNAQFITESQQNAIPPNSYLLLGEVYFGGGSELNWSSGDQIVLYRCQGICDIDQGTLTTFFQQGATPWTRWLATPELNKVNLYLGNSADPPVMQYPLRIQKGVNTINGQALSSGNLLFKLGTLSGWYIDLAEVSDKCSTIGTAIVPVRSLYGVSPSYTTRADDTVDVGDGIKVTVEYRNRLNSDEGELYHHQRWYITMLYRGITNGSFYEESDPIFKLFVSIGGVGQDQWVGCPVVMFRIGIDLSRLSKSVCGVRFYVATKKPSDIGATSGNDGILSLWVDTPDEYMKVGEFLFDTGMSDTALAITNATNAAPIVVTTTNHGLLDNDEVIISGVTGNTSANRDWTINQLTSTTFELNGSTGNSAYINGGEVRLGATKSSTSRFSYILSQHFPVDFMSRIGDSIAANLGHTPDLNRTRLKPRLATKVDRTQGALVAAYQDDRTFRFSCYSGAGTHMDDSFPDVSVDNNDSPQRVLLNGTGSIIHAAFAGGILCVFRYREIEFFDLEAARSGSLRRSQWRVPADVASPRGIVTVPEGLVWIGNSGFYIIRVNEGQVVPIGADITNLNDGSLKLKSDPTVSLWTADARKACVAGHDPTFQTVWYQVLTNQESGSPKYVNYKWSRVRNNFSPSIRNIGSLGSGLTPIKAFSETKADGTMTIIYADGLLTYPNVSGDSRFNDDVPRDRTGGNGMEFGFKIVLGSKSALLRKTNFQTVIADIQGRTVNKMGRVNLELYGNRELTPFDTKEIPVDTRPIARGIDQTRGDLQMMEVKISIPTDKLDNFREIVVSSIEFGEIPKDYEGNN